MQLKSATAKYIYEKDDFTPRITVLLIFYWLAAIQYSMLRFGIEKVEIKIFVDLFSEIDLSS